MDRNATNRSDLARGEPKNPLPINSTLTHPKPTTKSRAYLQKRAVAMEPDEEGVGFDATDTT